MERVAGCYGLCQRCIGSNKMKIFLNAYTDKPDTELLKNIWDFITGRKTTSEFESFIYENMDNLKDLFNENTVLYLLEFPYKTGNLSSLRLDLKAAVEALPTNCECMKIPDEADINVNFWVRIENVVDNYFDKEVLKTFDKIATDEEMVGHWQSVKDRVRGVKEFFGEGNYYKCRECGFVWLYVMNECGDINIFKKVEESQAQKLRTIRNLLHYEKVNAKFRA